MRIELQELDTGYQNGSNFSFNAPRGDKNDKGEIMILMPPFRVNTADVWYELHMTRSRDDGKTWSPIVPCEKLKRVSYGEGLEACYTDVQPMYHRKTGVWLGIGQVHLYLNDELAPEPRKRFLQWNLYNEEWDVWEAPKALQIEGGEDEFYAGAPGGGTQCVELEDGDILVPYYHMDKEKAMDSWHNCFSVTVFRFSFDGKELRYAEKGSPLTLNVPRGLMEPSLIDYKGEYYLCLRNDVTGYLAKSKDGLHYGELVELCFDDGSNVGSYNTQQHWIKGGGRLYLVYTRRGANNDHIFRHRAPLFMAEVDSRRLCLKRETEQIVVPERGVQLGNFGCFSYNDTEAYVLAAEAMQSSSGVLDRWQDCVKYGSKGSLFMAKIIFG